MKYILLILSLFTLALLGVKASAYDFVPKEEKVSQSYISSKSDSVDNYNKVVSAFENDRLLGDMVLIDAQSLARQVYGTSNRSVRTTTLQYISYQRSLVRLMTLRMELLNQCISLFNSVPCFSWTIPSDYYVFGMRRILI